jgi:hypothetical protein
MAESAPLGTLGSHDEAALRIQARHVEALSMQSACWRGRSRAPGGAVRRGSRAREPRAILVEERRLAGDREPVGRERVHRPGADRPPRVTARDV